MISGIVKQESLENVPAAEMKSRKFSEAQKAEDKQQKTFSGKNDASADTKEAMGKIEQAAQLFNRKIHLEVDNDLHIMIVKIIDSKTDEVIRQIPPEELVELSKNAKDLKGLLISKEG